MSGTHEMTFMKVLKETELNKRNLKVARLILVGLCALNFALIVYSATSHYWVESMIYEEHRGLWKYCLETCFDLDDLVVKNTVGARLHAADWMSDGTTPTWLYVCRVSIIVAAIFSFFAFLVSLFGLFNRYIYGYYSSVFSLVTFTGLLMCVYIFSERTSYFFEQVTCGESWGIAFLAVILTFLSGFTGFCTF